MSLYAKTNIGEQTLFQLFRGLVITQRRRGGKYAESSYVKSNSAPPKLWRSRFVLNVPRG